MAAPGLIFAGSTNEAVTVKLFLSLMINDRKDFDVSMKWRCDTDAWSCCTNSSLSWVKHFPQTSPTLNKSSSHTSATDSFLTELHMCVVRRLWILNANISHSFKCIFWIDFLLLIFFFFRQILSWPSFSAAYSTRTRRILQEAREEGRPCPSQLTQTKPCPIRPCYRWLLSDWSPCTLEVRLFIYLFRGTDKTPYWQTPPAYN